MKNPTSPLFAAPAAGYGLIASGVLLAVAMALGGLLLARQFTVLDLYRHWLALVGTRQHGYNLVATAYLSLLATAHVVVALRRARFGVPAQPRGGPLENIGFLVCFAVMVVTFVAAGLMGLETLPLLRLKVKLATQAPFVLSTTLVLASGGAGLVTCLCVCRMAELLRRDSSRPLAHRLTELLLYATLPATAFVALGHSGLNLGLLAGLWVLSALLQPIGQAARHHPDLDSPLRRPLRGGLFGPDRRPRGGPC